MPSNLETRLVSVSDELQVMQSSSEQKKRSYVLDRLGKAPVRSTIHPRRRLGPVTQTDATSGTSRSETTTAVTREGRRPVRNSLMCKRPIPSPWHIYKENLMILKLQTVRLTGDAIRVLNGARLSVNGLYSIVGVDWLIAAEMNFSSTTALWLADFEGLLNSLQDVKKNHSEQTREERPGRFMTRRSPIG